MSVSDLKASNYCQAQEIKQLQGDVGRYAAHANALIDAELDKKDGCQTKT